MNKNMEMKINVQYDEECVYTVSLVMGKSEAVLECLGEDELKHLSFADMLECMEYANE